MLVRKIRFCNILADFKKTTKYCLLIISEIVESELTEIKVKQSLFDYLFLSKKPRKYNKWIRPVEKSSDTIDVFLKLKVNQVIDVDEKNQLIHTSLWLKKVSHCFFEL